MRPNRKADLQRKLALAPVPKPPSGLADRIKKDIPKHLVMNVEKERAQLRQSVAFNVRVAASIILLVSSAYLALHLLSRTYSPEDFVAPRRQAPMTPPPAAAVKTPMKPQARLDDRGSVSVGQERPQPLLTRERKAKEGENRPASQKREEAGKLEGIVEMAPTPAVAPAPPLPPPAATAANAAEPSTGRILAAKSAAADALAGRKAVAGSEVSALVQRFAAPESRPVRDLRLETEAAAAPLDGSRDIVRISIDAPESAPPAAADVSLDIAFNDAAIDSLRTVTGRRPSEALRDGSSVTALYEFAVRPGVSAGQTIATVRLRFRPASGAEEKFIEQTIRRSDIHSFEAASKRMKAATLAAALRANPAGVAAKAREAGLDELAALAENASVR